MAENEGARKTGKAYVMCTTPDVCLTNGCPVPYSIISYLDCAQKEVETVRMTGQCALSMDSHLTTVIGDAPGSGGGVASGVNLGYCVPITHSSTVRAKGQYLLYHSSEFWMNCPGPEGSGNTKGKLQYIQDDGGGFPIIDPQGTIAADTNPPVTNPPVTPETPEEDAWWQTGISWLHTALDVVGLVPVFGEVADGANAAIHGVEAVGYGLAGNKARALENTGMAALSVAAMWPVGGQAATAAKLGIKGGKELVEAGVKKEAEHLLKEGLEEGGEVLLKKQAKEAAEKLAKEEAEKLAKEEAEKAAKSTGVQVTKQPPKQKHEGFRKRHSQLSKEELEKSARSFEKQIQKHKDWMADPRSIPNEKIPGGWDSLDPRHQKDLLENKWPSDIERLTEQKEIVESLLKDVAK